MTFWPLLILLPPLAVTLFGGRSAWLWLSLGLMTALLTLAVQWVLFQFSQGNVDPLLKFLVTPQNVDLAYHDSYYVIANYSALANVMIPAFLIGPLLLLPAHPRRTLIDIALFWSVVALSLAATYVFVIVINGGGMPRRYLDYAELETLLRLPALFRLAAFGLLFYAAVRPILSWWRARKAAHAL